VRRLLVAVVISLALITAAAAAAAPAQAAGPCVTLEYIALLGRADSALAATPPQPTAALVAITHAEDLAQSATAELAPIIAGLTASPPDVTGARQRINLSVTTLALPAGSASL